VLRTDEDAISTAARCVLPSGKRHRHQYRIPKGALGEGEQRLLANSAAMRGAADFRELHDLVRRLAGEVRGIGELAVYDISLRIGARFGLEPMAVYLHSGTRKGAQALGFDGRRQTIDVAELPLELQRLSARELEDFLCIYKDSLAASAGEGSSRAYG
jgi:hypothetical protein